MTNWLDFNVHGQDPRYEVQMDADDPSICTRFRYRVKKAHPLDTDRPWWAGKPPIPFVSDVAKVARVEKELSHVWGQANPELFTDSVLRFQEEHPSAEWEHRVSMHRKGFLTLIAIKRDRPYDLDCDYLKEIGY